MFSFLHVQIIIFNFAFEVILKLHHSEFLFFFSCHGHVTICKEFLKFYFMWLFSCVSVVTSIYVTYFQMYTSEMEVQHVDGHLQCRFIIPRESFVQKVIQNSSSLKYNTILYDHAEEWYLQLAWGKTMPGCFILLLHQLFFKNSHC